MQQKALTCVTKLNMCKEVPTVRSENKLWLETFITNATLQDLSESDNNVTYFVAVYIGSGTANERKCASRKTQLVQNSGKNSFAEDCISNQYNYLFNVSNRGGLAMLIEFRVFICVVGCSALQCS